MRLVAWTDADGFDRRSWLRDQDGDDLAGELGIPHDPPDVRRLGLDTDRARALHNLLVKRKLLVWQNATRFKHQVAEVAKSVGLDAGQTAQLLRLYVLTPSESVPELPFDLERALDGLPFTHHQRECIKRTFSAAGIANLAAVENAPTKVGHICGLDIYVIIALLLGKGV